ncbi:MAG: GIY-YIG nuclease family protein, partial [Victivallales bacterium]|nr:GIY-YIG nuclease family protein [Victivallales bacterium]
MKKTVVYQQSGTTIQRDDFYPGCIPPKPGVYIFRDRFGKIIYIGKAANLRKRLSSYFQPSRTKTADPKIRSLLNSIHSLEFVCVKNEPESLILESNLIKEYAPKYNSLMRDDKRFMMARINTEDPFPTLRLARVRKNDGATYFGPFPQGTALRKTVEFLLRKFRLRVCTPRIPTPKDRKHCLARIVKDCCEPCTGKIPQEEYRKRVEHLLEILNGDISEAVGQMSELMLSCVKDKNFEKAAEYRDMIDNVTEIFGKRNRSFMHPSTAGPQDPDLALRSLQHVLDLPAPPRRIECFDVSNISGSLAVAAMVCFIKGRPDKTKYRRFRIKGTQPVNTGH